MKFKKLGVRMLAFILPIIIIAMTILTVISAISSQTIIEEQITDRMYAELEQQNTTIQKYMNQVSSSANDISKTIATTYQSVSIDSYTNMLGQIVESNDLVLGSGIWFEPNVYNPDEKYMGPYVVKDGSKISTTYEYSNATYDYFNQEYYKKAKNSLIPVFTDPYYDSTSGKIMSSCSSPILDDKQKFIGCVTVDVELTKIEQLVNDIKVGKNGIGCLLAGDGTFLGYEDKEKVESGFNIKDDENESLVAAANKILSNNNGMETFSRDGETYNLYYDAVGILGWKLVIRMPVSELNEPVLSLLTKLVIVCIIALLASIAAVVLQVRYISRNLKRVQIFANALSQGDFTVDALTVKSKDELGNMGESLNQMYDSNKGVITNIAEKAEHISDSSEKLSDAAKQLAEQFSSIQNYMDQVNEDMMSASAATEEVNASTEEVNASVNMLAEQTESSMEMSNQIKERAGKIGQNSKESFENAIQLSGQYEKSLSASIKNAEVVENIGTLAGIISEIAEQINLLSLNASIEAARAGEQGRGFAVVATEIGKLANETAHAVEEIQETVTSVQTAFNSLTQDSSEMITFLKETVTPDYDNFVKVAEQYGSDANSIEETANSISKNADNIRHIMHEVSEAIQSIAETSQNTADNSGKILQEITEVSQVVSDVTTMSDEHRDIANDLESVVDNFKLD